MKKFLSKNFLLETDTAQTLYHDFAKEMPIIDYHCHLPPDQIADDINFNNLTHAWLYGDHYKWRAMRTNGIEEKYCTGNASDFDKFQKWAETVPYTLRNPLYHWTHLELQRYFDIDDVVNGKSAKKIYETATGLLQTKEFSVRNLMRRMNVKVVCTTDDPVDSLEHHKKLKEDGFEIQVLPAFRPDKAMNVDDPAIFNAYVLKLEAANNISVSSFSNYLDALKARHDFFAKTGCLISDHGVEQIYAEDYTDAEISAAFDKIRSGQNLSYDEILKFRSAMLYIFAVWDWEKGWVQQYHFGALRNNNTRLLKELGPDTGWDSIGDFPQGRSMSKFFDRLDSTNQLTKTILYNLNPADNELIASMTGNFNDGSYPGKIQFGSGWWFLDQKDGMVKQLNALSNMGLLSRFVGMLTDSRSFLSFPRHEYFRRILCSLFGNEIENGELPNDIDWTGKVIQDICYNNALNYFKLQPTVNLKKEKQNHLYGHARIFLAAVGERMTEVAGEVADGMLCHGFTTEKYLREVTLPALERGAARAGRSLDAFELSGPAFVVTGTTEEEMAKSAKAVRERIAFYGSTPSYRPVLERHGWGELQTELNSLSKLGEWERMGGLVDDDMLDAFAVVAEPEQLPVKLHERYGDIIDRIRFYVPYQSDPERWAAVMEGLKAA